MASEQIDPFSDGHGIDLDEPSHMLPDDDEGLQIGEILQLPDDVSDDEEFTSRANACGCNKKCMLIFEKDASLKKQLADTRSKLRAQSKNDQDILLVSLMGKNTELKAGHWCLSYMCVHDVCTWSLDMGATCLYMFVVHWCLYMCVHDVCTCFTLNGQATCRVYSLMSQKVCFKAFCLLLEVGRGRITRLIKGPGFADGIPPVDLRCVTGGRSQSCAAQLQCDAFFNYIWEVLAEPLAECHVELELPESLHLNVLYVYVLIC
jgi:hypothetical protein